MRLSSGYEDRKARVEMLPLIDIVFLLLVFFIYAMLSMVVHLGLRVELPTASTARVDTREYVSITLTSDNAIYLDKERVALDELADRVVERMDGQKDTPIFIHGDIRAELGVAIQILDLLKRVGVRQVSFECTRDTR
jgi:biopolymer transport protein ExbD